MMGYPMSFKDFAAKEFKFTHGAPAAGKPGDKPKDGSATKSTSVPEKATVAVAAAPKS